MEKAATANRVRVIGLLGLKHSTDWIKHSYHPSNVQVFPVIMVVIPPINKVWGYTEITLSVCRSVCLRGMYRNDHPVSVSVCLFTLCPGLNF